MTSNKWLSSLQRTKKNYCFKVSWHFSTFWSITIFLVKVYKVRKVVMMIQSIAMIRNALFLYILDLKRLFFQHFQVNFPQKIPLNSFMDFSVIYYIKSSVVALFSVNPMHSVNPMSVKVMQDCILIYHGGNNIL